MARDVEWHLLEKDGRKFYNLKAMTDRARTFMCADMVGSPWELAKDVFWMHVEPEKFPGLIARLNAAGLRTEDDYEQREDALRALTEF